MSTDWPASDQDTAGLAPGLRLFTVAPSVAGTYEFIVFVGENGQSGLGTLQYVTIIIDAPVLPATGPAPTSMVWVGAAVLLLGGSALIVGGYTRRRRV
jgi:hypothetical protein